VFAPEGPLAASLDGFEARPGQRTLAAAVARTIDAGGTLVAEAGTGTGKTFAYLVPAVLAGKRVLISTGTRNLQDQIFYKDIPALARAAGLEIRAAYMKGRTNYLCRHRFDRVVESSLGMPAEERAWLERIAEWSGQTDTGDRAEIEDLPDDFALWTELSATSEQCLGRECPRLADCFVTRMRDRAAAAQVVVVNHHLLCADASVRDQAFGEVIPECGVAVIDGAHQLEDVVTQYFGVSVSAYRFEEFVRDATSAIGAVAADQARFAVDLMEQTTEAQTAGRRLFDDVRREVESRGAGGDRHPVDPATAERLQEPAARLNRALRRLAEVAVRGPDVPSDLASIAQRAAAIRADLDTVRAAADGRYVHFIERRGRGIALRAAPVEVADIVRDSVLSGRHATVLTSATLTVDGGFDYVCGRLGVTDSETLRLASEFDFRTQAILYLPPGMPDPRTDGFNASAAWAIGEILDRTEGRAFVLFTSYAAMRDVHARLARRVRWPLLVQGTAPRPALLRDFRATPHAVLLATSSFWQGVDVAGEALSCVIVDRLPFASPGDPVVAARIAAIGARGGDAFNEYQVPVAALTLLQGLGRLIRSRADRGVLAILDPRLTQKPYGRRFLASLPPAPITTDLRDIDRFFDL
jgi:ATP-dependent DNA helicase DinG